MSPSQIENSWLRLEPPFFQPDTLESHDLDSHGIDVAFFANDEIAAKINSALRRSIEQHLEKEDRSHV